jgi:hypothetical protein
VGFFRRTKGHTSWVFLLRFSDLPQKEFEQSFHLYDEQMWPEKDISSISAIITVHDAQAERKKTPSRFARISKHGSNVGVYSGHDGFPIPQMCENLGERSHLAEPGGR